jgi:hypothetical protein
VTCKAAEGLHEEGELLGNPSFGDEEGFDHYASS